MNVDLLFKKLRDYPIIFFLFILALGHLILNYEDLSVEGHSRLQTLTQILNMSHLGFFFQIEKGVPMDIVWEDPFIGFIISLKQLLISQFSEYKISIKSIYYIEFFLLIMVYIKPYLSKIFYLDNHIKFALPIFFIISIEQNIISYSYSGYWAQNLYIISLSLYLLSYVKLLNEPDENIKRIIYSSIYSSILLSIFALIRRNLFFEVLLIFILFFFILVFFNNSNNLKKKFFFGLIPTVFFLISYYSITSTINYVWEIRDKIYDIKIEKRNPTHPLWVPLYAGLGQVDNNLGIKFDDGSVYWDLKKMFPEFEIDKNYGSKEYEKKVKKMYFETIKKNPELLLNSIIKKTLILLRDNKEVILLIVLMFLYFNLIQKNISINLISSSILFSTSVVPILTSTFFHISFKSALWFWIIIYLFYLLSFCLKNFNIIKKNIIFQKIVHFLILINSHYLFQAIKKILFKIIFLLIFSILILFILFNIFDQTKMVVKRNVADIYLSWTTEKNKFYNKDMEEVIKNIKFNDFNELKFKIDNKDNDLKYIKIKFISNYKIKVQLKEVKFFDKNNFLITEKKFFNKKDLNFLLPSNNKKEIFENGLLISKPKRRDKSSNVELYEDISPYNQNIPKNLGAVSVILSVSNDFKINFYEWLKFLISYN